MKNYYLNLSKLRSVLLVFAMLIFGFANAQNIGFESTTVASPPTNWSAVTGTWTVHTTASNVRTGSNSMAITDPATTGTTIGTTNPFVTTATAGNYLITIGWGKANNATNGLFHLGYRSGTTNTLNPSSTSSGQAPNLNDVTWSRITSVSSATVAAGSYGVSLRAFRSATSPSTTIYIDDIIMYASTSNVPDYSEPSPVTNPFINGNALSWINGVDNGSPASGIAGVIILRADGINLQAPTLNNQAMYNTVNGDAGTASFISNAVTWTVVGNIQGSTVESFVDAGATGGPYTYAIYMRDRAYNYSLGATATLAQACTNPVTPGNAVVSDTSMICPGSQALLNVSGSSFGIGQTYRWQSSTTINGTYTYVDTARQSAFLAVNPMATTFYRCEIVCSGGAVVYSTPVQVKVFNGYSGVFTINASQPTGGSNYQTFAAAISAMTFCGITGPVVFNVDSASGPFTSQINIPEIIGASASNTVTFNGNGVKLNFLSTVTGERAGIKLNGADYVTINNFDITATGTSTTEYGFGIQLLNNADHNIITNNTININQTSTSTSNYVGIIVNSTATAITTAGASLCDSNIISNNKVNGGYTGIALVANGATSIIHGNKILNNIVKDFYLYGIYLNGGSRTIIESNRISRPNRTSVSTFDGIYLTGVSTNTLISKNTLYDPFLASPTSTAAGFAIYLNAASATLGNENIISNNLIYNHIGSTGNRNGVLINNSSNVKVYHNTIYLNDINATCTACAARGIYVQNTATTGLDFRNNNIYIEQGGTSPKQAIFFEPTSVSSFILENNNYYITSTGGTYNEVARIGGSSSTPATGTGFATLSDWKLGSGKETYSTSLNPQFIDASIGNLKPSNSLTNNKGVPVGISTDINNDLRSANVPDVGAFEYDVLVSGLDISAEALLSPSVSSSSCYTSSETVTVRLRNNSFNTINFVSNPVTVNVTISGAANQVISRTINSDTLASNGFIDVTMTTPADLSLVGSYNITTVINLASDVNLINDTLKQTRTKVNLSVGTVSVSPSVLCGSTESPLLTATGLSGYASLQWQSSTTSGTGFTDIVGANTAVYQTLNQVSQTTYYRLAVTCGTSTIFSTEDTLLFTNPQVISTSPGAICGPGTVTLSAQGSPGSTLSWYDVPTAGTILGVGNNFNTPNITSSKNYYVSATEGGQSGSVGPLNPSAVGTSFSATAAAITTYYMEFNVSVGTVLKTVDVFPTAATGSSASIEIRTVGGVTVAVVPYVTDVTGGAKQTVTLNVTLAPGVYRMGQGTAINLHRNTDFAVYPYNSPVIQILSNNFAANYYYYFFNWQYGVGCESARTLVTATIQDQPSATFNYQGTPFCGTSGTVAPNFTGTTGGKFSSSAGLAIDSTTGVINLANSTIGTYTVNYTIAANGACPTYTSTATLVIANPPSASISYSGSPYCTNGGSATVIRTGDAGGIYSSSTGLIINSSNGTINLANSVPGTYTVNYTIPANGSCPLFNTTTSVTINLGESASINYVGSPFCSSAGIINPNRTGSANGTYSSTSGLDINPTTGAINVTNSTPGSYTVSYTIPASAQCSAFVASANIVINQLPSATIQYSSQIYCRNTGTATVQITGTTGGTFSSASGLSINSSTGEINLGNSTAGTYNVNYTIPAGNGCPSVVVTTSVQIIPAYNATFSYGTTTFCANGGERTANLVGSTGGTFSSSAGLSIDSLTGSINLNNSLPGTYTVSYTIPATGNCGAFNFSVNITINALPDAGFTYEVSNVNGLQIQFNSNVTSAHTHAWNFGDPTSPSNTSSIINPIHVFTADGIYNVSHTVTQVSNGCSDTYIDTIEVVGIGINSISNSLLKFQAQPNPFNEKTTIVYELKENAVVSLEVYDLLGRKVSTLISEENKNAGKHYSDYNKAESTSDGVYLLKLTVNGQSSVIRLMEIK